MSRSNSTHRVSGSWAACGKDPGFSPLTILEQAARSGRYSATELLGLSFDGPPPDIAAASQKWHGMLKEAREIITLLPAEHAGKCVLHRDGGLYSGGCRQLERDLSADALMFHPGCIRGAYPQIIE